jgi:hypothetical protein
LLKRDEVMSVALLSLTLVEGCEEPYVRFLVDGKDLGQRLRAACSFADDVLPWRGIDYQIEDTVLGREVRTRGATDVILFACGCGCSACGSVTADVAVDQGRITLSHFTSAAGVIKSVEPITFDLAQFNEAYHQLGRQIEGFVGKAAQ